MRLDYSQYLGGHPSSGDSPLAREGYRDMYLRQRAENFGLGPNSDSASYLSPVRRNTETGELGMWNLGGGASHGGHGAHEGDVQQTFKDWYKNKEWLNKPTGSGSPSQLPTGRDLYNTPTRNPHEWANAPESLLSESSPYQGPGKRGFGYKPASSPVGPMPDEFGSGLPSIGPEAYNTSLQDTGLLGTEYSSPSLLAPASDLPIGPSGLPSIDQLAGTGGVTGGAGSGPPLPQLDTAAEAGSEWGGPETFVANMALDMIPTQDRKKINLPWGDKGSASGTLKGAGKGALTGLTLSGGNPYGALVGGLVGAGAAGQGYFDSTSAPTMSVSRIKRGQGRMPVGGLLGMGGGMYA